VGIEKTCSMARGGISNLEVDEPVESRFPDLWHSNFFCFSLLIHHFVSWIGKESAWTWIVRRDTSYES
jgi:hypothetical protein